MRCLIAELIRSNQAARALGTAAEAAAACLRVGFAARLIGLQRVLLAGELRLHRRLPITFEFALQLLVEPRAFFLRVSFTPFRFGQPWPLRRGRARASRARLGFLGLRSLLALCSAFARRFFSCSSAISGLGGGFATGGCGGGFGSARGGTGGGFTTGAVARGAAGGGGIAGTAGAGGAVHNSTMTGARRLVCQRKPKTSIDEQQQMHADREHRRGQRARFSARNVAGAISARPASPAGRRAAHWRAAARP